MQVRFQHSPAETRGMDSKTLRENFLFEGMVTDGKCEILYTHYDRMIIGAAKPTNEGLSLQNPDELKAAYFLERREIGIVNVGAAGSIIADGSNFAMDRLDCLYLPKGTKEVRFQSNDGKQPAIFYLLSAPAHARYEAVKFSKEQASPVSLGDTSTANQRTIYKYIHADGIQSCQLVMGLTILQPGSVWNSVPPHTHTRRMEAYFYFDLPEEHRVLHVMGEPQETRHLIVANHQAVISPAWSVHFGSGTTNYGFIWGMAGENYTFTDMDPVAIPELR